MVTPDEEPPPEAILKAGGLVTLEEEADRPGAVDEAARNDG